MIPKAKCDNCTWIGFQHQADHIEGAISTLEPGSIVPAGQCPECGAYVYLLNSQEHRGEVVEAAELAFWAVVAEGYPEAKSGDLGPFESMEFSGAAKAAVRRWVEYNVEDPK